MKKRTLALTLCMVLLVTMELQGVNVAKANPMYTEIPPKVNVPEMNVNAAISRVNGTLWVKIDAEYKMHTIYAFGDSFLAQNKGMGLMVDPSPYVTVTVTEDTLEAHYPIPFNAANISVKINDEEVEWRQDTKGYFHLFGINLQEINWTVSPVPYDFNVAVHYEHPISRTTEVYAYLGDYAFTLPLYGRYGCSKIMYPLYDWTGYPPIEYNIQIESVFPNVDVYSIDNRGTLIPLNYLASTENGLEKMKTTLTHGSEETTVIQGAVAVFNAALEETELSPTMLVVAAFVAAVAMVGVGLLVYSKKRRREARQV